MTTFNGKGQHLVQLGATPSGEGTVATHNGKGQGLACLASTPKGEGMVATLNGKGQGLVWIGGTPNGGSVLVSNKTGENVCTMVVDEYGNGRIGAWNRQGRGRTLEPGP